MLVLLCALLLLGAAPEPAAALGIIDYQHHLPHRFRKVKRRDTRFIIVHCTGSGLSSALRTLSPPRMANYLVARDGRVYRVLSHRYRANHAGRSMWGGITHLSNHSVGIELVGYYTRPFTNAQYRSLKRLLEELQKIYRVPDRRVLEHYRVAYGRPNIWIRRPHRGRKRDPGVSNFSRVLAGLTNAEPQVDPDVAAGRLLADPEVRLAQLAWRKRGVPVRAADRRVLAIGPNQSAWEVAGVAYDRPTTIYTFPGGRRLRGDQIRNWSRIPKGTRVSLGPRQPAAAGTVTEDRTPWKIARGDYNSRHTRYTFPNGRTMRGDQVRDWTRIPPGTRVEVRSPTS
jgi:hypothetical protein